MLLKDSFYTITKTKVEDNQLEVKLNINANHEIFEGHFPGNPITPGVVQLEILKELLSIYAGKTVQMQVVSNCKYLTIMNPENCGEITVKVGIQNNEGALKINAVFQNAETVFTKVSGIYC